MVEVSYIYLILGNENLFITVINNYRMNHYRQEEIQVQHKTK